MPKSQPQAAIRRKLLAAARSGAPAHARNGRALPQAWFLTDPKRTPHPDHIAARLPKGFGVIFRHFGATDRFEAGRRLAKVCRTRRLVLLVSADPDLARALRADGLHWPESRLHGVRARHPRWIETASSHAPGSISRSARLGIDAVILSAVFASSSVSAGQPRGPIRFRAIAVQSPLPVYALGGITAANAAQALSGAKRRAAGWAAIDAVMSGWGD
jgi:thiamine-phosphate pyrophosphorylase